MTWWLEDAIRSYYHSYKKEFVDTLISIMKRIIDNMECSSYPIVPIIEELLDNDPLRRQILEFYENKNSLEFVLNYGAQAEFI